MIPVPVKGPGGYTHYALLTIGPGVYSVDDSRTLSEWEAAHEAGLHNAKALAKPEDAANG